MLPVWGKLRRSNVGGIGEGLAPKRGHSFSWRFEDACFCNMSSSLEYEIGDMTEDIVVVAERLFGQEPQRLKC